jgi:hypothetical protein
LSPVTTANKALTTFFTQNSCRLKDGRDGIFAELGRNVKPVITT